MCIRDRLSTAPRRNETQALVTDAKTQRERRPFRRPTNFHDHSKSKEPQPRPVSYTHLDVYKRQLNDGS